jgi:hypothetical protein
MTYKVGDRVKYAKRFKAVVVDVVGDKYRIRLFGEYHTKDENLLVVSAERLQPLEEVAK